MKRLGYFAGACAMIAAWLFFKPEHATLFWIALGLWPVGFVAISFFYAAFTGRDPNDAITW